MAVTIYNPTTGKYVTSLATSATAQKQGSTASIKSQAGGQATPFVPTATSVKVSLSTAAKAVLAGSTKLKVSELVQKLEDPKYSPTDLSGLTVYVDRDLKELMPPAVSSANYQKILTLLTSQGGRKLMDVRANNDVPVKLDIATYQMLQDDMRDATRAKAGASKVAQTTITTATQGSTPITLSGNPGEVVKWYVPGSTPDSWTEVTDPSLPASLDKDGALSVALADLPSSMQGATKIMAEVHSSALLDVVSNLALDLPAGTDGKIAEAMDPAVLNRFKQLIESNKATRVTIDGQASPVTLTPDTITALGAKTLARYPGRITVDATSQTMLTEKNWESMRLLNNFREVSINLNQGVPASKTPLASLSDATSKISYQQFIGGFSLISSISTPAAPVALEPSSYDATTKTQKVLFSGLFMNGDTIQLSIAPPGKPKTNLSVGPLILKKGASPVQQADALVTAINTALGKNADYAGVSATRSGNELSLTYSGAAPAETPPLAFIRATRIQEGAPSFGFELTDVPPSAAQSLTGYSQVYGLNVKGSATQLFTNSDKLNSLVSNGFVKSIQLTDSGTVKVNAGQAIRSIPLLEKISGSKIAISDYPTAPSSYAQFTNAAADNLVGGIRIVASAAEILNSLSGVTALARMGKISTMVLTGTNGRQTVINNFDASKLSALVVSLRQGG